MFRHFFNKILSSRFHDSEAWLLNEAFKLYLKNIVVGLFCSVFMMLFPYLQFVLIRDNISVPISALLVFAAAFLSAAFLYTPFIISVHRARISKIWSAIWHEVLATSVTYSMSHSVLYAIFYYTLTNSTFYRNILPLIFTISVFILYQLMLLKISLVVFNCEIAHSLRKTVLSVINSKRTLLAEMLFCGFSLLIIVPLLLERGYYYDNPFSTYWSFEKRSEFAHSVPILFVYFIFPIASILPYTFIRELSLPKTK